MRRRILFVTLMVLALAIFAVLILLRPSLWTGQLMSYFNSQLTSSYGVTVETGSLSGNFLNQLNGESVIVSTADDSVLFTADGIAISYSLWKMFLGQFAIDQIHLSRPVVHYGPGFPDIIARIKAHPGSVNSGGTKQFTIENLSIEEGQFIYPAPDEELQVTQITGEMRIHQGPEALSISGDFSSMRALKSSQRLRSIKFQVHQYRDSVVVDQAQFSYDSVSAEIQGVIGTNPLTGLSMDYRVNNISASNVLPFLGLNTNFHDTWTISGNVQSDLKTWNITSWFDGHIGNLSDFSGHLAASLEGKRIQLHNAAIQSGPNQVDITGTYSIGEGGAVDLSAKDVDLGQYFASVPSTNFTGALHLQESSGDLKSPSITTKISLGPSRANGYDFSGVDGVITYRSDTLRVRDSLKVTMDATDAAVTGWYTLNGSLNLSTHFQTRRFDYLTQMLHLPTIYGEASGTAELIGSIDSTAVNGRVNMRNFGYQEFHFKTIAGYFNLEHLQKVGPGHLFVEARNGMAWGQEVASGSLTMEATKDSIILHNLRFENGSDHLYISGGISEQMAGVVETLELQVGNTFAHNRTPLTFRVKNHTLFVSKGVIGINDGFIAFQGEVSQEDSLQTRLEFTNITLGPLIQLLPNPVPVRGIVDGEVSYTQSGAAQTIQTNLVLNNAAYRDIEYTHAELATHYIDSLITIDNWIFTNADGGEIRVTGEFPWDLKSMIRRKSLHLAPRTRIQADVQFESVELGRYSKYIPMKQPMAGLVTGDAALRGDWANPVATANLTVLEPQFDRITGDSLSVHAKYQDDQLVFQHIFLDEGSEENIYTGQGSLPITLNFARGIIQLNRDKPMDLHFRGEVNHLQFLERYMSDVDAISGDFVLNLDVVGTPYQPVRNGSLTARNGQIEVTSLENEITNVSATARLQNNKMTITSFSSRMREERESEIIEGTFNRIKRWLSKLFNRKITPKGNNITATGTLDFRKFFEPGLNLSVKGDQVYIRSLLSEVEGVLNPQLTITGRDSLLIQGDLDPEELVLRMDFAKENTPNEPSTGGGRYIAYNLHADFPGDLYIRNNQINAELEGDIYILRHGDEPVRYSGVLNVVRGKFYYNGTFTIEEGQITFDPVELNPRLNIVATTKIENVTVTITLTDEMDNPTIELSATDPNDPNKKYSQSEILSLLTFNQQIEQEGLVTPDIQPVLSAYLERQLESYGNQLIGLETFNVETQGQTLQEIQSSNKPVTVTVGRRVTSNLFFTFRRDFFATNPTNLIGLEYQLNRYMSLVGQVDENGLYHLNYRLKYNY